MSELLKILTIKWVSKQLARNEKRSQMSQYSLILCQEGALSSKHPPFLLPVPLKTHHKDIVVSFQQETGATAFAILSHLLR